MESSYLFIQLIDILLGVFQLPIKFPFPFPGFTFISCWASAVTAPAAYFPFRLTPFLSFGPHLCERFNSNSPKELFSTIQMPQMTCEQYVVIVCSLSSIIQRNFSITDEILGFAVFQSWNCPAIDELVLRCMELREIAIAFANYFETRPLLNYQTSRAKVIFILFKFL